MQLPRVLQQFKLFVDGAGYAGVVDRVEPPHLTHNTEEYRAGAMPGPVQLDMGLEAMTASFHFAEYNPDVIRLFGMYRLFDVPVTCRGAMRRQGEESVTQLVLRMRGGWNEVDPGEMQAGQRTQMQINMSCKYYQILVDGQEVAEVDVINMIYRMDGTDFYAGVRAALDM